MKWRAFVLRRLLGRLKIGDDILRYLSTFQRLGATFEVVPPREMLPVGARTILRAIRTRGAADIRPDWLWPYWLEQQLDPTGPAFTPRGHLPAMQNVTHRNWTLVGNLGSAWEGVVDPTGLVMAAFDAWSLDWWVHAGGRWHFPSRAPGVRQSLVGATPVVQTELELPTGAAIQRVYAVETVPELVTVEVENATPEPLDVAFAVRPYNTEGLAVVESIRIDDRVVTIDRRQCLYLSEEPERTVLSTFTDGDSARLVAESPGPPPRRAVTDKAGLAQGAFVLPVAPGQRIRAAMTIGGRSPNQRWPLPWRRRMRLTVPRPERLPSAEEVAREWEARLRRGTRVELPDRRLEQAVDANRAFLRLLHDPGSITAGPFTYHRFWFRDAAYQVAALDRWGLHEEAADVLRSYPERQVHDGYFYSQWREWDANGAAIWTIAEHHRLTGDDRLLADLAEPVARGARWIVKTCADDRGKDPEARGLMPAGISAEHFGPFDYYYWDDLWALRGLIDAAAIARWCGDEAAADATEREAGRLRGVLFASIERAAARVGRRAITTGPTRGLDAGMIGSLAACYPLGLLEPNDPLLAGTAEAIREHFCLGEAFYQAISHTGLGTYLTLQLAFVELFAGDERAWRRLQWVLDAATPTFTWPEAIHPQLPGGCMGDGHHGWMAADLLNFVRHTLVRETPDGLVLFSLLPEDWAGERVALHDAPTHHGAISFELDWDGDRPVLRWQAERPVSLTAPGLDPDWGSSARAAGEARLAPLARSGGRSSRRA